MKKLRYAAAFVLSFALLCALSVSAWAMPFGTEKWTAAVYTGDNMNVGLWIAIVCIAALLIVIGLILLLRGKKKNQGRGKGGHER